MFTQETISSHDYFLHETEVFDGEYFTTFTVYGISLNHDYITLAISCNGKVTLDTFQLFQDDEGQYYIEYGPRYERVTLKYLDGLNLED